MEKSIDTKLNDQLKADYIPLVRFWAQRIESKIPYLVDIDLLIEAGIKGVSVGIERFTPNQDTRFREHIESHIRMAILDRLSPEHGDKVKEIELLGPLKPERDLLRDCLGNQTPSKDIRRTLLDRMEELPEKQKLVLSLYYYEDLSLNDIGEILEIPGVEVDKFRAQALEVLKKRTAE